MSKRPAVLVRAANSNRAPRCRVCDARLTENSVDLGMTSLCERFIASDKLHQMERCYPLKVPVFARGTALEIQRTQMYTSFSNNIRETKRALPAYLIAAKDQGKPICIYGALGDTLLNYSGIEPELLEFTVDSNAYTRWRHSPGMHIAISPIEAIEEGELDHITILPRNLKDENFQEDTSRACPGCRFVIPIPPTDVIRSRWSVL